MKLFVLMRFYESVHINLSFLKSKPCEFTGPLKYCVIVESES